jgi:hypothetical protein
LNTSASERADIELDRLITKRHDPRDGDALLEPTYAESARRYNRRREEENRQAWADYHRQQAQRFRALLEGLVSRHEERALALLEENNPNGKDEREAPY